MWKKICLIVMLLSFQGILAQQSESTDASEGTQFVVEVKILDKENDKLISTADVSVNGAIFSYDMIWEGYLIRARINDELVVRHPDFKTVYHTIKSKEKIKIYVVPEPLKRGRKKSKRKKWYSLVKSKGSASNVLFQNFLDSARYYKKRSIDKSLSYVELMLKEDLSPARKAKSLEVLGQIYSYWKQYDLAIENFEASLREKEDIEVRLLLARTQFLHGDFEASEKSYRVLFRVNKSQYNTVLMYEGLGDVAMAKEDYAAAVINFEKALITANENLIRPKITDLNSKLAEVYAKQGRITEADSLFQNSLELAHKENLKRSLEEEEKVANFFNISQRYDDEIELRKNSLKKTEGVSMNVEDKESLVDSITSQKINYKIGNAYLLKDEYGKAIPFFEKSIVEADKSEDLIVQKDATRKLSEVYESVGAYSKAFKVYREYVELVDSLYVKKEQELQQIKRFNKRIAAKQNRIASLEKDRELSESKINLAYKDQQLTNESNRKQQVIIYSLIGMMLLISFLVYFLFRYIRQQKLANNLLALKSMRSQMNPHFIFNALNSVNSFIAVNDERSANRYLSEFSILMRSVLENSEEDFIPLSKEIELLQLYVKLEHNRFQDKFDYEVRIEEDIPQDSFSIPPMLLQPYIENAIWHGLRYKKDKGQLSIYMELAANDVLRIRIEDDGVGRQKSMEMKTKNQLKQKSKGMSTIKNRIDIMNDMYSDIIDVRIMDAEADGSGTVVLLELKKMTL
ncbi:Histidine kinase [Tenacibaculum litopenaei]|jgi:tetratricopeptide (TPR) repeat protein|uniref:histidine kinase n=1 Tax=Tenacibaculum litopenaei TaxID=396016 RepID=UPI00389339B2